MSDMTHHLFGAAEILYFRKQLLNFYGKNKRKLPWRDLAITRICPDERAYAVWVSEIMLQQTQVATVIPYYNRWMEKWPNVMELSKASLEDVKKVWSGLGYYSRGERLHQGSQKVVNVLEGCVPRTAKDLQSKLPGVGRYTAGAIASIAYNEVTGVVDGNVIRVLSRMRLIGADSNSTNTSDLMWELANTIVDDERPGDFNQAMMELGATVCTPKSPKCKTCPVNKICKAHVKSVKTEKQQKINSKNSSPPAVGKGNCDSNGTITIEDIEDIKGCPLCLPSDKPWDPSLGVMNYPRKPKKKKPNENTYIAALLIKKDKFFMTKRPDSGLLAGLWEFPLIEVSKPQSGKTMSEKEELEFCRKQLSRRFDLNSLKNVKFVGNVSHVFSHMRHHYHVYEVLLSEDQSNMLNEDDTSCWTEKSQLNDAAISTAIRKIMKIYDDGSSKVPVKRKRSANSGQRSIDSMFKKVKM